MHKEHHSRSFLGPFRLNHGLLCIPKTSSVLVLFFLCFVVSMSTARSQATPAPPTPPPPPSYLNGAPGSTPPFNPSMAIVMVVLVTVFFFMGFFSVYIRQFAQRRIRGGNWDPSVNFGRQSRRPSRGLDASVIDSFPTFLYSAVKGHKIGKDALECAVCLNEFEDDQTLRLIPKCNHVFHPDCIDAWLSSHSTCPVCRANLAPKPGESISCASTTVQIQDSDSEPENNNNTGHETSRIEILNIETRRDSESPNANLINSNSANNHNRPPRSRSTGWMLTRFFPLSPSTGDSVVQPGENCERFTLRLPVDVRSQLMNSSLSRTKSCVVFSRARSSRRGYRSRSLGRNNSNYERFDWLDRWGFKMTPFFPRTGSVKSPKRPVVGGCDGEGSASASKGFFTSIKSPFDRLLIGGDAGNVGERSSDRLRPESKV